MSHFFVCNLTKERAVLLVNDYVKRCNLSCFIPMELIMLLLHFYNEVMYWDFTQTQLPQLITSHFGFGFTVKYNTNLSSSSFKDCIQFQVPHNKAKEIFIRCRIFCDNPKLDLDEIYKIQLEGDWNPYFWETISNINSNTCFCIVIEILHIIYLNGSHYTKYKYKYKKNFNVNSIQQLKNFENTSFGQYFFAHCFGVKYSRKHYKFYLSQPPKNHEIEEEHLDLMLVPSLPVYIITDKDDDDEYLQINLLSEMHSERQERRNIMNIMSKPWQNHSRSYEARMATTISKIMKSFQLAQQICGSGYGNNSNNNSALKFDLNTSQKQGNYHSQILKGLKQRQNNKVGKLHKNYRNNKKFKYHRW